MTVITDEDNCKAGKPNEKLKDLLEEVGWRPESLARRINAAISTMRRENRQIHHKTPYRWLNRGEVPHAPVPEVVVWLLADATGRDLTFDQVWPRGAPRSSLLLPADHRLDLPWDAGGLLRLLEEWSHPMLTRRTFMAVSGMTLTRHAWQWAEAPVPALASAVREGDPVTAPMLELVEEIVARCRRLDERHGAAGAAFVADQFACVSRLLRRSRYDARTGRRLTSALAQLAQTSGFMAFDSARDGEAQRWYLVGLRAAHAADDRALAASILGLMSNQATETGRTGDALQLATAAQEAASQGPSTVRALIAARSGLASAVAGDSATFQRLREQTLELIDDAKDRGEAVPDWAGYVTRTELDAIAGRGMVVLAGQMPTRRRRLLAEAQDLLSGRARTDPSGEPQRSALRHGAWLGLAHVHAGDLDQAVAAARRAVNRLPGVTSARSTDLLQRLGRELAPHARRSPEVKNLLRDLEGRLPT
ncbi:hypothetical protein NE235_17270 [Actinoallomurus spadix]|uniref:Transcriptional regulator n=1 Tax=Actinoallomurus spadix TaxID=79912 RepID=A0ABN0XAC6_9ACTN|nr:hypothetical protein [Actinoallomurus spadix]MCO5987854.1 hypothetical protein [Actinoallomurus spadix]